MNSPIRVPVCAGIQAEPDPRALGITHQNSNPTEKGNANERYESKLVGEVTVEPGSKRIREVVRARAGRPLEGGSATSYRGD